MHSARARPKFNILSNHLNAPAPLVGCSGLILTQASSCASSPRSRLDGGPINTRIRAGGGPMRFYNGQHRHYCGIDLHVKTMYVCILDAAGQVLLHRNVKASPEAFLEAIAPYREDLVVAAECMFTWYWLPGPWGPGGP